MFYPYERRTGEPSRKRMDFEAEVADRLARAKEAGELEWQGRQIDRGILDLSGDLEAAKLERDRQPAPEVKQAAAAGVAVFRAMFEAQKLAELGKQQAREAFERQKAEQARQQVQADRLKELADQRECQRQEREAKKQERDGPGWSR